MGVELLKMPAKLSPSGNPMNLKFGQAIMPLKDTASRHKFKSKRFPIVEFFMPYPS